MAKRRRYGAPPSRGRNRLAGPASSGGLRPPPKIELRAPALVRAPVKSAPLRLSSLLPNIRLPVPKVHLPSVRSLFKKAPEPSRIKAGVIHSFEPKVRTKLSQRSQRVAALSDGRKIAPSVHMFEPKVRTKARERARRVIPPSPSRRPDVVGPASSLARERRSRPEPYATRATVDELFEAPHERQLSPPLHGRARPPHSVEDPRKDRDKCKDRPSSRQSRSGSGGSRPFVPWCDRRG